LAVAQAAAPQAQVADHVAVGERLLQLGFDELVACGHRVSLIAGQETSLVA
jgi:hypothetical protein